MTAAVPGLAAGMARIAAGFDIPAFVASGRELTDKALKMGGNAAMSFAQGFQKHTKDDGWVQTPLTNAMRKAFDNAERMAAMSGKAIADNFLGGIDAIRSGDPGKSFEAATNAVSSFIGVAGSAAQAVADVGGELERFGPAGQALANTIGMMTTAMQMFTETGGQYLGQLAEIGDVYLQLRRTLAASTLDLQQVNAQMAMTQEIMGSGAVDHFEDVSQSIARFARGLNLAGPELRDFTETYASMAELIGSISPTNIAGVLNAYMPGDGIVKATGEVYDYSEQLTRFTNIIRATGGNAQSMVDSMIRVGPAMRALGYDAGGTALFFGSLIEEGLRGQKLVYGMNQIVEKLHEPVRSGKFKDLGAAWKSLLETVKSLQQAGQGNAAIELLSDFTTPANASLLAEAIQKGVIRDATDMGKQAGKDFGQSLSDAAAETSSLSDVFENVQQQFEAALSPVGLAFDSFIINGGNKLVAWLAENQMQLAEWASNIGVFVLDGFQTILKGIGNLFIGFSEWVNGLTEVVGFVFMRTLDMFRIPMDILGKMTWLPGSEMFKAFGDGMDKVNEQVGKLRDMDLSKPFREAGTWIDNLGDKLTGVKEALPQGVENLKLINTVEQALKIPQLDKNGQPVLNALGHQDYQNAYAQFDAYKKDDQGKPLKDEQGHVIPIDPYAPMIPIRKESADRIREQLKALHIEIALDATGTMITQVKAADDEARRAWMAWIESRTTKQLDIQPNPVGKSGDPISELSDVLPGGQTEVKVVPTDADIQAYIRDRGLVAPGALPQYGPGGTTYTGLAPGQIYGLPADVTRPAILKDRDGVASSPASIYAAAAIARNFPQVTEIGGGRLDPIGKRVAGTHDIGQSIDIAIPWVNGQLDMALGDRMNEYLKQNAEALNIEYTMWRVKDHFDHIDVHFKDGGVAQIRAGLPTQITSPGATPYSAPGPVAPPAAMPAGGIQGWLLQQLLANGLSPDQARGVLAMNAVEGGAVNANSILGFVEGQDLSNLGLTGQTATGPEGHLAGFMAQWRDMSRRNPGGGIPGVAADGSVTDWNAFMTWIRIKIVGQNGDIDWQLNQQPNPQDYQNRLMEALRTGGNFTPWSPAAWPAGTTPAFIPQPQLPAAMPFPAAPAAPAGPVPPALPGVPPAATLPAPTTPIPPAAPVPAGPGGSEPVPPVTGSDWKPDATGNYWYHQSENGTTFFVDKKVPTLPPIPDKGNFGNTAGGHWRWIDHGGSKYWLFSPDPANADAGTPGGTPGAPPAPGGPDKPVEPPPGESPKPGEPNKPASKPSGSKVLPGGHGAAGSFYPDATPRYDTSLPFPTADPSKFPVLTSPGTKLTPGGIPARDVVEAGKENREKAEKVYDQRDRDAETFPGKVWEGLKDIGRALASVFSEGNVGISNEKRPTAYENITNMQRDYRERAWWERTHFGEPWPGHDAAVKAGMPALATGGEVWGAGTATSDSIPAWLSNGEFVQNAAAVSHYGTDFMHAINQRKLPKFNTGGEVGWYGGGGDFSGADLDGGDFNPSIQIDTSNASVAPPIPPRTFWEKIFGRAGDDPYGFGSLDFEQDNLSKVWSYPQGGPKMLPARPGMPDISRITKPENYTFNFDAWWAQRQKEVQDSIDNYDGFAGGGEVNDWGWNWRETLAAVWEGLKNSFSGGGEVNLQDILVPGGSGGIQEWLRGKLTAAGFTADQMRGILAMNSVEGGASDPRSVLGFTDNQAKGPEAKFNAFLNQQWNDMSRRPGGKIPGMDDAGNVTNWADYMTWLRVKIVGQTGVKSDWEGNAQPPAEDYQRRLMQALVGGSQRPLGFDQGGLVLPGGHGAQSHKPPPGTPITPSMGMVGMSVEDAERIRKEAEDAAAFMDSPVRAFSSAVSKVTSGTWWLDNVLKLGVQGEDGTVTPATQTDTMTKARFIPGLSALGNLVSSAYGHFRYGEEFKAPALSEIFTPGDNDSLYNLSLNDLLNFAQTMDPDQGYLMGQDIGNSDLSGLQRGASGAMAAMALPGLGKLGKLGRAGRAAAKVEPPTNMLDAIRAQSGFKPAKFNSDELAGLGDLPKPLRDDIVDVVGTIFGATGKGKFKQFAVFNWDDGPYASFDYADGTLAVNRHWFGDLPALDEAMRTDGENFWSPMPNGEVDAAGQVVGHEAIHAIHNFGRFNPVNIEFVLRNLFAESQPMLGLQPLRKFSETVATGGSPWPPEIEKLFQDWVGFNTYGYGHAYGEHPVTGEKYPLLLEGKPIHEALDRFEMPPTQLEDVLINWDRATDTSKAIYTEFKAVHGFSGLPELPRGYVDRIDAALPPGQIATTSMLPSGPLFRSRSTPSSEPWPKHYGAGSRADLAIPALKPGSISVNEPAPFGSGLVVPNLATAEDVRNLLAVEYGGLGPDQIRQLTPKQTQELLDLFMAAHITTAEEGGRLAVENWPYTMEFNPFDEGQLAAIRDYTAAKSPFFNLAYADADWTEGMSPASRFEMGSVIDDLDAAIIDSPRVPAGGMMITRAMGKSWRKYLDAESSKGYRQESPGYQSASPGVGDVTPWLRETMARIFLPEGTQAIYVSTPPEGDLPRGLLPGTGNRMEWEGDSADTLSLYPNQNEIILPRHTGLSVVKEFKPVSVEEYFARQEKLLGLPPGSISGSGAIQGWGGPLRSIQEVWMVADQPVSVPDSVYHGPWRGGSSVEDPPEWAEGGPSGWARGEDEPPFATGGEVWGPGTGTSDNIAAWLSNGEFVHNAAAVNYYGTDFMHAVNSMKLPRFAPGGLAGDDPTKPIPASERPMVGGGQPLPYELANYHGMYDSGPNAAPERQAADKDNPFVFIPLGPKMPYEEALKIIQAYVAWQEEAYKTLIQQPKDLAKSVNDFRDAYNTAINKSVTANLALNELLRQQAVQMAALQPGQDPTLIEEKFKDPIAKARAAADVEQRAVDAAEKQYLGSVSAVDKNRADQLAFQLEGPPVPDSKKKKVKADKDAESLGAGLVKGILQEFGFPDVFGDAIFDWGIWKKGMGLLGFGMNLAQNAGLLGAPGSDMNLGLGPGTAQSVTSGAIQNIAPGINSIPGVNPNPTTSVPSVAPASSVTPAMSPAAPDPLTQTGGTGAPPGPQTQITMYNDGLMTAPQINSTLGDVISRFGAGPQAAFATPAGAPS